MRNMPSKLVVIWFCLGFVCYQTIECTVSFDLYVYIGQSVELRCEVHEATKFTRIQHHQPNGTVETLLSNDYLNDQYKNSEIHVKKVDKFYIVRIQPVRHHSAGLYTCEDDVSLQDNHNHIANLTLHVIGIHAYNPYRLLQSESSSLAFFQHNLKHNAVTSDIKPKQLIAIFAAACLLASSILSTAFIA